jgi:hypothetical protein
MDQEGKKRLPGPFILCLSGLSKPPPLLFVQLRRLEARGHKTKTPKRQRSPFRGFRLMLVASNQAASAFEFLNRMFFLPDDQIDDVC